MLVGVFAFSLGSSWDIAGSFPPRGTDWGHYLLYADEVEAQGALLIDDPLAGEEDRVFADPAGVGAVVRELSDPRRDLVQAPRLRRRPRLGPDSAQRLRGRRRAVGDRSRAARCGGIRRFTDPARADVLARAGDDARTRIPPARRARARAHVPRLPGSADDRASRLLARGGRRVAFHERRGRSPADRGRGDDRARPHAHHQAVVPSAIEQRDTPSGPARRCRRLRPRGWGGRAPEAAGGRAGLAGQLPAVRARLARMSRPSSTTTRGRSSRWLR